MRFFLRLALGLFALLVGARLWAVVGGRRAKGAFYLTGARQVRLMFWPLAALVAALPFLVGISRRAAELPPAVLAATVVVAVLLLSLSVPALALHARHHAHDSQTVVLFDAQTGHFEIRRPGHPFRLIRPATLAGVVWARPRAAGASWGAYETLRFNFGALHPPLTLSSVVLDLAPVVQWLRTQHVVVADERRRLVWP